MKIKRYIIVAFGVRKQNQNMGSYNLLVCNDGLFIQEANTFVGSPLEWEDVRCLPCNVEQFF